MGKESKAFGAGSIITALLMFLVTSLFGWIGSSTVEHGENIAVLNKSVENLNTNVGLLTMTLEKMNESNTKLGEAVIKNQVVLEVLVKEIEKGK